MRWEMVTDRLMRVWLEGLGFRCARHSAGCNFKGTIVLVLEKS